MACVHGKEPYPKDRKDTGALAGNKTFSGTLSASGTVTVSAASASIGAATTTATYGMGAGATTTGVTKTVNLGTGGTSGSTTAVNIGSATADGYNRVSVNTPVLLFNNAGAGIEATVNKAARGNGLLAFSPLLQRINRPA